MTMIAAVPGLPLSKRVGPRRGPIMAAVAIATLAGAVAHFYPLPGRPFAAALRHLGMDAPPVPQRADIVDRHGALLAHSVMVQSLYADPRRIADPNAAAAGLSAVLPGLDIKALTDRLSSRRRFVWIARQLTPDQKRAVDALSLAGLGYRYEERRVYPLGAQTVHVVGYVDVDHAGIAGVEAAAEKRLMASRVPLRLTLDAGLQTAVHGAVQSVMDKTGATGAAAIVMNALTGEIIVLVSLPDFDPRQVAQADLSNQRFDRATQSVMQLDEFYAVFRTALARERGESPDSDLPAAAEQAFMRRLGFLSRSPLDFPEQSSPLTPGPDSVSADYQHRLAVTGVQLATAYSAMVNGGTLVTPTLIERRESVWAKRVISGATSAAMRVQFAGGVSSLSDKAGHAGFYASALVASSRYVVFATLAADALRDREALRGQALQLANQVASQIE